MHLHRSAIQRAHFDLELNQLLLLQNFKDSRQHPGACPAPQTSINRVPVPILLGQLAPLRSILRDVEHRVQGLEIAVLQAAAVLRKTMLYPFVVLLTQLHLSRLTFSVHKERYLC